VLMRYLFVLLTTGIVALYAEVSVFGAGDLKNDNPYGLSETEKVVFSNKKATLKNAREIRALKLKIEDMSESIEGLRSVVESLSKKVGETGQRLHEVANRETRTQTQDSEIAELRAELEAQKKQNEKILRALKKLTTLIDSINADYVSRSELQTLKKKVTKRSPIKKSVAKSKPQSNAALLKEAIRLYRAKKYADARALFTQLDEKGYKQATDNFYLGEIAYYQKAYEEAILYYKKSASLYDKATYMPTLLLHTAISFEKIGDTENADKFFQAIIDTYPGTSQAKIAAKHL